MRRLPLLLIASALCVSLTSCGKAKEVPYKKLGYSDNVFTDPETGKRFTGVSKDYYKDGTLKAEYPFKNGLFEGTVKEWHPNGKPLAETAFVKGERTGQNREWTEAGLLYRERVYDRDKIVSEKNFEAGK
ncbi:MAG: toxin-antitoxin system YwqK family antitoxin [Verrucomicrobium sp.]